MKVLAEPGARHMPGVGELDLRAGVAESRMQPTLDQEARRDAPPLEVAADPMQPRSTTRESK